jgi:TrmH family RNA methyltransferase
VTPGREITSPANPRIKEIVRLHNRAERDETGRFLIEGTRELERASAMELEIELVLLDRDTAGPAEHDLARRVGAPVIHVTGAVQAKVSRRQRPAAVIAVAKQFSAEVAHVIGNSDLILVADGIEKPGNLGAMLRTADGAGAGAIVCGQGTDLFNPNVVRASQGSLFVAPVAHTDTETAAAALEAAGFQVVVASPEGGLEHHRLDLSPPTAIVVGSEHRGVSARWLEESSMVSIPMKGTADSLNASVAAAVILYEAVRQRSSG